MILLSAKCFHVQCMVYANLRVYAFLCSPLVFTLLRAIRYACNARGCVLLTVVFVFGHVRFCSPAWRWWPAPPSWALTPPHLSPSSKRPERQTAKATSSTLLWLKMASRWRVLAPQVPREKSSWKAVTSKTHRQYRTVLLVSFTRGTNRGLVTPSPRCYHHHNTNWVAVVWFWYSTVTVGVNKCVLIQGNTNLGFSREILGEKISIRTELLTTAVPHQPDNKTIVA